jgi:hypothetical protein
MVKRRDSFLGDEVESLLMCSPRYRRMRRRSITAGSDRKDLRFQPRIPRYGALTVFPRRRRIFDSPQRFGALPVRVGMLRANGR